MECPKLLVIYKFEYTLSQETTYVFDKIMKLVIFLILSDFCTTLCRPTEKIEIEAKVFPSFHFYFILAEFLFET